MTVLRRVIRKARHPGRWVRECLWLAATMALALLVAGWVLRLWEAAWRVPFEANADAVTAIAAVKQLLDHGWYLTNPDLGAPFGQQLFDFSGFDADNLQWIFLKVLSLGIHDPALLLNVYYFLGYGLVAGSAFIALRYFHVSRPTALVGSVLFAILPYHFTHGEGHLMLMNYSAVPAGCVLIMRVLLGRPFMKRRRGVGGARAWVTLENVGVAIACVLVGGSTLYYAVFTLILLMLAAVVRCASARSWRGLVPAVFAFASVAIILLVNLLPALVYRAMHGANPIAAVRTPIESEVYSFSLTQLLMPILGHRLAPLAEMRQQYQSHTVVAGENGTQLGLLLGASFVVALIALGAWALATNRRPGNPLIGAAAVGAFLAFLLGTFGGISGLIANLVSPQIRVWGRLTPFVAFFALVLLVLALDWLRTRLRSRTRSGLAGGLVLVAAGVIGVLDQTSPVFVPPYAANAAAWHTTATLVDRIEHSLPTGAMVLQLPLHPFPEIGPVGGMADYDHLDGYAHSKHLRWSYGAMKGRPEDWTSAQANLPIARLLPAAAAAGFAGVWVDRSAYPDHGAKLEASIRKVVGSTTPPIVSADDRRTFTSLRPLAERLRANNSSAQLSRAADALIRPTSFVFGSGFYGEEGDATHNWHWAIANSTLGVMNPTTSRRLVRISTVLRGTPGSVVTVRSAGRVVRRMGLPDGQAPLSLVIPADPGETRLDLHTTGQNVAGPAESRQLFLQLDSPRLVDQALILRS